MATISIRDSFEVEIVSASPQVNSGFGKYLRSLPAQLLARAEVAVQFPRELQLVSPGENGLGLTFKNDVPLGTDKTALSVSAGAKATLGVFNRAGMLLFEDTFVGEPLKVAGGQAFLAFAFEPAMEVGLKRELGNLSFGFDAGTESEFRCYRPFDLMGSPVTLAEAAKELFENFTIPNTVDDLKQMKDAPAGTVASVFGHGHLQIGCSVDVAAAFNPLASINTIDALGPLKLGGGASVTAGLQARVSGDFQVRVQKVDGRAVRLSYHKVAARELEVSLEASAGPGVTLGDRDLLKMLFGGASGVSGTSEEELVAAGLSSEHLARIKSAMKAGMSRKLSLDLGAQFSSMRQDEAAFQYEIDLDALDATGESAVGKALSGNLVELNLLEPHLPGHGIRLLQSRTEKLRTKRVAWRLNLVGIINVVSLTELVKKGTVFHDEESGELVITDEVSTERLKGVTESRGIRKLLYESVLLTATYKAAGLDVNTSLSAAQSFFHVDKSANRQRMEDYLDAVAAVGLISQPDIETLMGPFDDFGRSSLLLETVYDHAACVRLFTDNGATRNEDFYEDIGKLALLALVQKDDPDAYRRVPVESATLWKKMKDTGQPGFQQILPPPITGGTSQTLLVAVVAADYTLIRWWAHAMATAATRLADMRAFLGGRTADTIDPKDQAFIKKRGDVANAMVKAVQANKSSFDDPWGLVALFMASGRTATATGIVSSPRLTLFLPE